jgi:adenine/guanine phosphoribosyltransferase-like PRPP-binding protein
VTPATAAGPWTGQWVGEHVGLELRTDAELSLCDLTELVGVALRHNPRRAQLLVSHVLGKHVPAEPRTVYGSGLLLGKAVAAVVGGADPVVLGYAETATGLGHLVAEHLAADYVHSTRRAVAGVAPVAAFEEAHSHASSHLLLPDDPTLLTRPGPLVLVDDELSTGSTALETVAALHRLRPRALYVVAALVDLRSEQDRLRMAVLARELSTVIQPMSLGTGRLVLSDGFAARAHGIVRAGRPAQVAPTGAGRTGVVRRVPAVWPEGVRDGGRHGFTTTDRRHASFAAHEVAAVLTEMVRGDRVLVLGSEELMYAPLLIASVLARWVGGSASVRFSSTSRSPVHVIDDPAYPIRTGLTFPSHDDPTDGPGPRFAYNVAPATGADPFTDIVLVIDEVGDTPHLHAPDGLLAQLAGVCEQVLVLVLPSYRPPGAGTQ